MGKLAKLSLKLGNEVIGGAAAETTSALVTGGKINAVEILTHTATNLVSGALGEAGEKALKETLEKGGNKALKSADDVAGASNNQVKWVDENALMSPSARTYNDSAPGARSNVQTQCPQAPQINGPDGRTVRFDGQDGNVLIDRKSGGATTQKSVNQAQRQSAALREAGMTGSWEVSNEKALKRAQKVLDKAGAENIEVIVVTP